MPPTPFWAKPKFVFLGDLSSISLVHFAIRMALWPTLATDDSEQALLSQHFAWSYRYKAPPLFNWMLTALSACHARRRRLDQPASLRAARRPLRLRLSVRAPAPADPRLSALSVYSFAAINTFAEASHRELTHSTTLTAVAAVAWYVFLRLCAAPRLGWYLALGATFGFGMLAKWNFVILAACAAARLPPAP